MEKSLEKSVFQTFVKKKNLLTKLTRNIHTIKKFDGIYCRINTVEYLDIGIVLKKLSFEKQ